MTDRHVISRGQSERWWPGLLQYAQYGLDFLDLFLEGATMAAPLNSVDLKRNNEFRTFSMLST
eukprot:scaffold515_cov339-Pavlova_lutheri.AAC.6